MKEILSIGALCCLVASLGAVALNMEKEVVVERPVVSERSKVITVTVTLTKYQLEKMLGMLEEENGYGGPAEPQDQFTFTSIAREAEEEYNISSTHLARKPH